MASLAETIRSIATGKQLTEAAQPFMQANQPTVGDQGQAPVGPQQGGGPAPGEEPDLAGQQVVQAELILIADRAQKIAALAGQGAAMDPMLQTQITSIASDISQLYADLVMSAMPDPNADPNAQQGQPPAPGGSQVNTNPKVAEELALLPESIKRLNEISTDMARRYVNRAFTDLGRENTGENISAREIKNRRSGIKLAVDKAGGADKMWKNKSALGKKYGVPADEVRVKTTEEEQLNELGNPAIIAAADALKKGKPKPTSDTRMPGVRMPSDKIKEAVASAPTTDAEDDPNEHIIMQLHKSVTLGGKKIVRFTSGQKVKVDPKTAHAAIRKFSSLKPMEKAKAQEFLKASHNNLQQFVKEDISFIDEDEELQERVIKAEPHFIDRLEGSMNTSSGKEIEFENGQKVTIPPNIAKKIVEKFRSASAYDKQQLNKYVRSSYANLIRASRG